MPEELISPYYSRLSVHVASIEQSECTALFTLLSENPDKWGWQQSNPGGKHYQLAGGIISRFNKTRILVYPSSNFYKVMRVG
jgi:hypothetical protein